MFDIDPLIRITKLGIIILDAQLGTLKEGTPHSPQGVLPPPETAQLRYVSGLNPGMWSKVRSFKAVPSTPTINTCPGLNPTQQPVQWEAYRTGQITLEQWNALNPGFCTTCWWCNQVPQWHQPQQGAFPVNGPQGCTMLYWGNPYALCHWTTTWVYGPDDVNCWVGLWEHDFWANDNAVRFDVDRAGLITAHVGHGDHLDVHWADSEWTWTPCDLNGDGLHDQWDLALWDSDPYDWNLDGAVNGKDRSEIAACINSLTCYADCDRVGGLTANDFMCFVNAYAAGQSWANCDGSTTPPLLTANDFVCFIDQFAAGCS